MHPTRRDFLKTTLGAYASATVIPGQSGTAPKPKPDDLTALSLSDAAELRTLDVHTVAETLNPVGAFQPAAGIAGATAGLGLFFAFWSWVGFESTAMYGEEGTRRHWEALLELFGRTL